MSKAVDKVFKSKYHILLWILGLSVIMIAMMEYGYVAGGRPFGNYKVYTGLVPYCAWLVMTYLSTRPAWFVKRYNVADMYDMHRYIGVGTIIIILAHWYIYFGFAKKSVLGWWGGYVSLVAMAVGCIAAIVYLTPWFIKKVQNVQKKRAVWLHRLNVIALIAADIHIHGFKRLANMTPFTQVFDILTAVLVIYYLYWMYKQYK